MGLLKPPPDWILDPADELGDATFLVLWNEGAGATQVRDYASGMLCAPDPNMVWRTLPDGLPWCGPFLDNRGAQKANCKFPQGGPLLSHAMFQGNWSGGYTTLWIGLPKDPLTYAYIADNIGGLGNGLNYGAYLSSPIKHGWVGETVRDSANNVIQAALTEYPFCPSPIPWIAHARVMRPSPSGGESVYTNLDPVGLPTGSLRLAASYPTADCKGTVGPRPIGGINATGAWGVNGLVPGPAGFGCFGIWPGVKTLAVLNDWLANPWRMMRAP